MDNAKVKLGLQLNRAGILIAFLSTALHVALKTPDVSWLGALMAFTGQIVALASPPEAGRKLLLASVIATPLSVALSQTTVTLFLASALRPALGVTGLLVAGLTSQFILLAGAVLFMAYLARLARYLERPDLARQALTLVLVGAVSAAATIAGIAMARDLAPFIAIAEGVVILAGIVAYSGLLARLCQALDERQS